MNDDDVDNNATANDLSLSYVDLCWKSCIYRSTFLLFKMHRSLIKQNIDAVSFHIYHNQRPISFNNVASSL